MKVGETSGQAPDVPDPKRRIKDRAGVGASKGVAGARVEQAPAFAQAFFEATQATVHRALDQIMDELGRQGEKLAASQNFDELGKYKALVQEFLKKATQGIGKLHLTDGGAGRSAKVHVILKKVDTQLEALTREVLSSQATPINLLARLDQIRGLLLDFYK
jgi:uncharacterized protein YaaR (DUF327 family)